MNSQEKIDLLIDRVDISELVHRYPRAVDAKDWKLLSSLFTDQFEWWMGPARSQPVMRPGSAANTAVSSAARMERFPVTQHFLSDYSIEVNKDEAVCLCYMQARHHLQRKSGVEPPVWTIGGYYTYYLTRTADGWKIFKYTLDILWSENQPPDLS